MENSLGSAVLHPVAVFDGEVTAPVGYLDVALKLSHVDYWLCVLMANDEVRTKDSGLYVVERTIGEDCAGLGDFETFVLGVVWDVGVWGSDLGLLL